VDVVVRELSVYKMCTKVAKFILEINNIHNYTHTDRQTDRLKMQYSTIYDAFNWAAKIYEPRQVK